jgi:DNA primase large subunit
MEYEVCIFVETPPQYLKFYKTLEDYKKCDVNKIVVIGSKHSRRDREQYRTLKQIYNDIEVIFIDKNREKEKAEELLQLCMNAKHYHIRVIW